MRSLYADDPDHIEDDRSYDETLNDELADTLEKG